MDPIRLRRPERLEAVLRAHPHHMATLVGHAHTQGATTFAGSPLLIGGGVASTVPLDAEPLPRVWEAAAPSFAFHVIHDDDAGDDALEVRLMLLTFDTATPW